MPLLADLTWKDVDALDRENCVVVMPAAAMEQHGPHLPIQVDTTLAETVARRAAERAKGVVTLVAPCVWSGVSNHHIEFPGTLSLSPNTFMQVIVELTSCLIGHGFRRFLYLNGHGGNIDVLKTAGRKIRDQNGKKTLVAASSYWDFAREELSNLRESEIGGISHAGEFETSAMLAVAEEKVKMEHAARHIPKWKTRHFSMDFFAARPLYLAHHVSDFSPEGVFGDPTIASKEKGQRMIDAIVGNLAAFLEEFVSWEFDNIYDT